MSNGNKNNRKNQETKIDILNKCTDKRLKNPKFSEYIKPFLSENMNLRVVDCGTFLELLGDFEMENKKLHKSNFCKNRFCPMCSWRLACKDSLEISILMEHLRKEENKEFIFLTLTTPNVKGDSLEEEIKKYNKSFKKLMERKEVKVIIKGYIRKLEDQVLEQAKHMKETGQYDTASQILKQLKQMIPNDMDVIALDLEVHLMTLEQISKVEESMV